MKRRSIIFVFVCLSSIVFGQIPNGYYDGTTGLSGYVLKNKLFQITGQGFHSESYGDLWQAYQTSDIDQYYENDGTILDIYSENPTGTDNYEYSYSTDQCGSYSGEGSCYNREHLVPQSWFNEASPMKSDIHHIFPTDGYVNNRRGNHPFGEVSNPTYTSDNGSKLGPNTYNFTGAFTGVVFEPIDEFKGDIARAYFYMATRYQDKVANWKNASTNAAATFDGTSDHAFTDWMIDMLLKWNQDDPVSQREIDRNNFAYQFQGNRNPFIDHPEFANLIWGNSSQTGNGNNNPSDSSSVTTIFFEDFNNCSSVSNHFTVINEQSAENWSCSNNGENQSGAMQMYGFANNQNDPSYDWLITANPINFDQYQNERLDFYASSLHGDTPLELLYSTDYEGYGAPSGFTWIPVPNVSIPLYPSGASDSIVNQFTAVDISGITGQVYIAFKYNNTSTNVATQWTIDNFKIWDETSTTNVTNNKGREFVVYPNPITHNKLTIQLAAQSSFNFKIINNLGENVMNGNGTNGLKTIQLTPLQAGIYSLIIATPEKVITRKIVLK